MSEPLEKSPTAASPLLLLALTAALSLAILGGTIFFAAEFVRHNEREEIPGRYARIVYELWLSQKATEDIELMVGGTERVSDQWPSVFLTARLPQLSDLLGTRLFDTNGVTQWTDPTISESTLRLQDIQAVRQLKPVARFRPRVDRSEIFFVAAPGAELAGPVLEVCIPLHTPSRNHLVGIAQFIFDGSNVAAELHALGRTLLIQSTLVFLVGGGMLVTVLTVGFGRLARTNRLLSERTRSLLRANQELALAAKTSAVGAVTSHLIHGLKNPLSGLQTFVASRGAGESGQDTDWELAVSSTRRMHSMISEIVRVLRDEQAEAQYEMSLQEFGQMLEAKVAPLAREAGVVFNCEVRAAGTLQNREANLISLIVYNLVQNAIQATPRGKSVTVLFQAVDARVVCEVRDEGGGIPDGRQASLFKPCQSSKEGGSGIGLAISKQLANCLGADLTLARTDGSGSVFLLTFDLQSGAQPMPVGESASEVPTRSKSSKLIHESESLQG